MKKTLRRLLIMLTAIPMVMLQSCTQGEGKTNEDLITLVIIIDGLRKDYISETNTPNLYKITQKGVVGDKNRSVFPTVTRVNSTSYATGSYPKTHGILGNSIYLPSVNALKGINTGDADALMEADQVENGKLLHTSTFGEAVEKSGNTTFTVFSTGSTGQSYLLNQKISGKGIINPDLLLPNGLEEEVVGQIGNYPAKTKPNKPRHIWVTDAFIEYALKKSGSSINTIWYSDPDGTAHGEGIGSEITMEAIKGVDEQVGRILAYVAENDMEDQFNLLISADHGFATHKGNPGLVDFLVEKGLKESKESEDVVVVGGAIYLKSSDQEKVQKIVSALQQETWVGAIFTESAEENKDMGVIPGTLSFSLINWDHPERAADILVDVNWTSEINEFGYEGFTYNRGVAGHGSSSPYEVPTPFLALGPSFKTNYANQFPTSMIDIMPTVLHIHGIQPIDRPDGRVMHEILKESDKLNDLGKVNQEEVKTSVINGASHYELSLFRTHYGSYQYLDFTQTTRKSEN
ncbi:alkaline phosphatase family protein [Pararhodonellum marinum]|uniref:alkaline phosphatase family protein n=1 Tax=Pararhodonellum marinum TaxID=2755358 RepID=UPI0018908799|nr:alkaline phosphatase family protein [Pararhodonellum marinum]